MLFFSVFFSGGYYLTSLYAALFYISSFRPRLAKRQLSAEAHSSLSQWHRRRTLHCNQSRRSRNRRTIRRHGPSDGNRRTSEERDSLKASTDSSSLTDIKPDTCNMHESLQDMDEELQVLKEEEEGSTNREQMQLPETVLLAITSPQTDEKERALRVSWNESN